MKRAGVFLCLALVSSMTGSAQRSGLGTKTATIAQGAALTSVLDLGGYAPAAIVMPAEWTAADLTFQACTATSTASCSDLYDEVGAEVKLSAAAGRTIKLTYQEWGGIRFLRLRSGTAASGVAQAAARALVVFVRGL